MSLAVWVTPGARRSELAGVADAEQDAAAQAAYRRVVEGFADAGAAVVVVRDTPAMGESVDKSRCPSGAAHDASSSTCPA